MGNVIYVDKKLVKRVDNSYVNQLQVKMPPGSKYEGYYFNVSDYYAELDTVSAKIQQGSEDFLFILIKEQRELGKKYSRPKLSWNELAEEFKSCAEKHNTSLLARGLAFVYNYSCKGLSKEGHFVVGGIRDKWFYITDNNRRLISAKNFKLIKENLSEAEEREVNDLIVELENNNIKFSELTSMNGSIKNFKSEFLCTHVDYKTKEVVKYRFCKYFPELDEQAVAFLEVLEKKASQLEQRSKDIMEKLSNYK